MKTQTKNIWDTRREKEKNSGKPFVIYSAYPLIGRGTVLHETISHQEVEASFDKALRSSLKYRFSYWLNKVING